MKRSTLTSGFKGFGIIGVAIVVLTLAGGGCTTSSTSSSSPASKESVGAHLTTDFLQADAYADVRLSGRTRDDSLDVIETTFTRVLQQESRRFPTGSTLKVKFTEIDLAGWIPPSRGNDVRVVSSAYPARLELDYTLSIPKGGSTVEQSDHVKLTTFSDLTWGDGSRNQPLAIESKLLKDWLRGVAAKVR